MNWANVAALGLGYTKGRAQAEEKKKKDGAALLALTGRIMGQRQQAADRESAAADRRSQFTQIQGLRQDSLTERKATDEYRQAHDGETAKAKADAEKAILDARAKDRQLRTLGEYSKNAGNGIYANMRPEEQATTIGALAKLLPPGMIQVPGAVNGSRPLNYGLPPPQAKARNDAYTASTGLPAPSVPTSVPYFAPTADQVGKRAALAATTAGKAANTAALPKRLDLIKRGQDLGTSDRALGRGIAVRGQNLSHADRQQVLGQGEERIGQGNTRLTIEQMRLLGEGGKGQPNFNSYQTVINQNNAQKSKILSAAHDKDGNPRPLTQDQIAVINQADYNIQHAQHGQRALSRGVDPVTGQSRLPMNPMAGFHLQPLPGFSQGVPVLNAPPLPGGQAPHHSHAQPRRQTGEFKKGKAAGKTENALGSEVD
jgi:hypothetical protein